jgi:hypothetical protein
VPLTPLQEQQEQQPDLSDGLEQASGDDAFVLPTLPPAAANQLVNQHGSIHISG